MLWLEMVKFQRSWLVNVYKGKGDALACGSYTEMKLVEHAMKALERVIERRVRNIVKIDNMQFGFMAGHDRCNFHCSPATGEAFGK